MQRCGHGGLCVCFCPSLCLSTSLGWSEFASGDFDPTEQWFGSNCQVLGRLVVPRCHRQPRAHTRESEDFFNSTTSGLAEAQFAWRRLWHRALPWARPPLPSCPALSTGKAAGGKVGGSSGPAALTLAASAAKFLLPPTSTLV